MSLRLSRQLAGLFFVVVAAFAMPEKCSNPPLLITFEGSLEVECENSLTLQIVQDQPVVQWPTADETSLYTLLMADPDAPSHDNPTLAWYRHWLTGNILGSDLMSGEISGSVLSGYVPPAPPSGSGYHRYFFYLFRQSGNIDFNPMPDSRAKFNPDQFASTYNLGQPIAVNAFITKSQS
eukprot:m.309903 g.309903  ORF g.309903 m.309903 type:complete len:179 (+) comp48493_c0_seq1:31-567(+)